MLIKRIFKFSLGILTGEPVVLSAGSAITSNLSPGNRQTFKDFLDRAIAVTKPAFPVGSRTQLDRAEIRSRVTPQAAIKRNYRSRGWTMSCVAPSMRATGRYNKVMSAVPMVDLVGVGLNATDTVIPLPSYPARGSKTEYRTATILPGGQTATTVVACQHWGLSTRYVGRLGDDVAAAHHREFERTGVDARIVDSPRRRQRAIPHPRRRRRRAHRPLPARRAPAPPARRPRSRLDRQRPRPPRRWLRHRSRYASRRLGPRSRRPRHRRPRRDLPRRRSPARKRRLPRSSAAIFPRRLTGEPNLEQALQRMHRRYGCRLAAATLGQDGVLAWDGKTSICTPPTVFP